jgi:cation:H+ antiporter
MTATSLTLPLVLFVLGGATSLAASAILVIRLERLGERLGLSEAMLGLLAALAADAPEITSAITALAHGQTAIGAGVVLGSNVFNLAALLGLGAIVAGRIVLHRKVVIFEGGVALWIAAVSAGTLAGLITPEAGLLAALAVLAPYVAISAVGPARRRTLPLPAAWRGWLASAVDEEEQELSAAIHPRKGDKRDAAAGAAALMVVVAASVTMERAASTAGTQVGMPNIVVGGIVLAVVTSLPNAVSAIYLATKGRGAAALSGALNSNTLNVVAGLLVPAVVTGMAPLSGGAVFVAGSYVTLTLVTLALALAGRGLDRRSGSVIAGAYLIFAAILLLLPAHGG